MEPEDKIVIVTLPSKDDSTPYKTISTFTFPNYPSQQNQENSSFSAKRSLLSFLPSKKAFFTVAGFTFLAVYLSYCLLSDSSFEFLKEEAENDRTENSFWLPLYPKFNNRSSLLDMGSIKMVSSDNVRRKQSLKVDSSVVVPLRGNVFPDGQYYTRIFVGNPPRPYFLDVDTGSDLTWIQCDAPCQNCAKGPHPLYKPTKGKIVQPRDSLCRDLQRNLNNKYCDTCHQCDYEIEYADHSSSMGILAKDDLHLAISNGGGAKFDFVFGCAYDQQGQLLASPAKTDGILGLSTAKVSLPSQLADKGIINNIVGHCITSEPHGGGFMFFGDDFVPRWGMTWVPTFSTFLNFYQAEVHKLRYGVQQIGINVESMGQVVFDTGSSYTYFPKEAYTNLITKLESISDILVRDYSDQTLPVCWRAAHPLRSVEDVKLLFQPLTLQFGNRWFIMSTKFTIPPEGYLVISNKGNVCLGVLDGSEVLDGSTIILGDVSLRGKLVVYDNVRQRIGWAPSDCGKPERRAKDFPFFF